MKNQKEIKLRTSLSEEEALSRLYIIQKDLIERGKLNKSIELVQEIDDNDKGEMEITLAPNIDKSIIAEIVKTNKDFKLFDDTLLDMGAASSGVETVNINKEMSKPENSKPTKLDEYRRLKAKMENGEQLTVSEKFFCENIEKTFDESEKTAEAPKAEHVEESEKETPKEEPKKEDSPVTPINEEEKTFDKEEKEILDLLKSINARLDKMEKAHEECKKEVKEEEPEKEEVKPVTAPKSLTFDDLYFEEESEETPEVEESEEVTFDDLYFDDEDLKDEKEEPKKEDVEHDDKPKAEEVKEEVVIVKETPAESPKAEEVDHDDQPEVKEPKEEEVPVEVKEEVKIEDPIEARVKFAEEKKDLIKDLNKENASKTLEGLAKQYK